MRVLSLIFALGAIVWVMMQAAGGGDAETVIPESYQTSLKKAEGVEALMQKKAAQAMQKAEKAAEQGAE